jgi:hypothetical protein
MPRCACGKPGRNNGFFWCEDCEYEYQRDMAEAIWWEDTTPTYWRGLWLP